jgi:hypothetical protein
MMRGIDRRSLLSLWLLVVEGQLSAKRLASNYRVSVDGSTTAGMESSQRQRKLCDLGGSITGIPEWRFG